MSFSGIPDDALEFYEGLEADNSKAYWSDHKHVYESSVREPLQALCAELSGEFGEVYFFRPYRDVRFSKDKSPYKNHQGATVGHHYLHIGASGLFVAVGYHHMAPDQITRFREAVDHDRTGSELATLVDDLRGDDYVVGGDQLKTRPRGYPADHPRLELLRHRSLAGWREFGAPDWLPTPKAASHVAAAWRGLAPLQSWLDAHVGPSREPR